MLYSEYLTPLTRIEDQLSKCSQEQLHHTNEGKWSILQHLYHCLMVEKSVLAYIKLKIQDPSALVNISLVTRLKFVLFFTMLRFGLLKVKAPKIVQKFPKKMSVKDLMVTWESTRQESEAFFLKLSVHHAKKGIFRHMFIGRLNKNLTLKFIELHLVHHLRLCKLKP